MPLERPLQSLEEADLQELIANGVAEGRTVEYKQSLPGNGDEDKKEFLADISSFANAAGGFVVYGMQEKDGNPIALMGLQIADVDGEKLRLENMIRDGISPRIIGVELKPIPIGAGAVVLVIRVRRSLLPPHMVTYKGHSKFYSRNSAGKYPLAVEELRSVFTFAAATKDRLRSFRAERISNIVAGVTPVPLLSGPLVILHVIPLSAFESMSRFDVSTLIEPYEPSKLQPIFTSNAFESRYNFDGAVTFERNKSDEPAWSYVQFFRDGIMESVNAAFLQRRKVIPSEEFEGGLLQRSLPTYLAKMKNLGVPPPIFLGLSLTGVAGFTMGLPAYGPPAGGPFGSESERIDRDTLILPEAVAETFESKLDKVMKPVFDSVWNAAGCEESAYYKNGEWKGNNKFFPSRR
jgi:hypothetical protein